MQQQQAFKLAVSWPPFLSGHGLQSADQREGDNRSSTRTCVQFDLPGRSPPPGPRSDICTCGRLYRLMAKWACTPPAVACGRTRNTWSALLASSFVSPCMRVGLAFFQPLAGAPALRLANSDRRLFVPLDERRQVQCSNLQGSSFEDP